MAKEFTNDGNYIYIDTEYAEAYIPNDIFDNPNKDPSPSSVAYETGDGVVTIGIFYMRFFNSEDQDRNSVPLRTLNYPNIIETFPSGTTSKETLTLNGNTDTYRVLKYYKGDILMSATSKKAATNAEMFTKLIMNGKIPNSLAYAEIFYAWDKNFDSNSVNSAVPSISLQTIISEMCRDPNNLNRQFRFIAGDKGVDPHSYIMLNMNAVSAYSSVMSSMSFERFAEKLTTSLIMTKENIPQKKSPIEKVITM